MALTTATQNQLYQFFAIAFDAAPGVTYMSQLTDAVNAGMTVPDIVEVFTTKTQFTSVYPNFYTSNQFATKLIDNVVGNSAAATAKAAAVADVEAALTAGWSRGQVVYQIFSNLAAKPETDATWGNTAKMMANQVAVAKYVTETQLVDTVDLTTLKGFLANVTAASDVSTPAAIQAITGAATSAAIPGQTFTLTTGADLLGPNSTTATLKTTSGDDTIYALTASSLTSADIIDGAGGTDSLIADYNLAADDATTTVAPVLTSVEKVTLRNTGVTMDGGETLVFNAANSTGITSVTFDQVTGKTAASNMQATNLAAAVTNLGISKNAVSAHTYTFTYADAAVAGATDAVTLNVTGNTTATGAVVIRGTTSTASGQGVETVTINTTGTGTTAASTLASVLSADGGGTTSVLKTLKVTGTSDLTINGSIDFAGTSGGTIDATGMSGNLTLTATTGNEKITFTGGSGKNNITTAAGDDNLTGGASDDTFTIGGGNDTVVGGAGNDKVILASIADLNSLDNIDLGEGARDTLAIGTWTAVNTTNFSTANKALIAATVKNFEVVELTAADVSAVDYSAIAQDIVRLSAGDGGNGGMNTTVTNVLTNDVLILNADVKGATGSSAIAVSGNLPSQTFKVELYGSGIDVTNVNTASTDHGLETSSNVTTLAIDSSKAATDTSATVNSFGGALHASAFAIKNTSAQNVTITGNKDLTINNSTSNVGFSNGVNVDAGTFSGKLVIAGSDSNDVIKGGTAADTIYGTKGSDTIDLSAGGADTYIFRALNSTDKDTIKGFSSDDKINVAALGDGTTGTLAGVVTSAVASKETLTDDRALIINTNGMAGNLFTGGTATVTDWSDLTKVAAYLNERYDTTTSTEQVFIINDTTSGQNKTYVINYVDAGTATIANTELTLVGVIENGGAALGTANVVFA